ncbi:MAG: TetR/AcrR family transcriptional regulator C-terminal domain-containing protein [Planctomycetota bacterium]|jgi:hypothetical protein
MEKDLGTPEQQTGGEVQSESAGRQRRTARYDERLNAVLTASSALLLLFLIQLRAFESLCKELREIIKKETDPQSCLQSMINMHFEYFIRNMNDLKICSREIESLKGSFYDKVAEKRKEYFDLTQSIFEKLGDKSGNSSADSRLAALYLFGTLNWIYQWYKPGRYPDAGEMASQLSGIYLQGFPQMGKQQS